MDVTSMGVDVESGPRTELDQDNRVAEEKERKSREGHARGDGAVVLESGEKESDKLEESAREKAEKSDGEEDTRQEEAEDDVPTVRRRNKKGRSRQQHQQQQHHLPAGWERHEDELGPYYWHVKSGNIQREAPEPEDDDADRRRKEEEAAVVRDARSSKIFDEDFDPLAAAAAATAATATNRPSMSKSCTAASISELAKAQEKKKKPSQSGGGQREGGGGGGDWKRRSLPPKSDSLGEEGSVGVGRAMQIQVQSLGCLELREDELTPENSSKAVNRCIVQLCPDQSAPTSSQSDPEDPEVGRRRSLTLELCEGSLKLVCPESRQVLSSQPIHSIRVWGVGRDNGRDFAYVARDKHTRKHLCHVFRFACRTVRIAYHVSSSQL